jgi:hypothetical protein
MDKDRLDKLISCSKKFKDFDLYTSCEAHGTSAELIRSGLNYNDWINNLKYFADNGHYNNITIMMTISSLCLFSITNFLDDIINLKRKYDKPGMFNLSINILRFPSFQSVNLLPSTIKNNIADHISEWLELNTGFLKENETNQLQRLVAYLRKVDKSYEDKDSLENKQSDFYNFFSSYTSRREINIIDAINNPLFTKWWKKLSDEQT